MFANLLSHHKSFYPFDDNNGNGGLMGVIFSFSIAHAV
jgi:hypothetical protein